MDFDPNGVEVLFLLQLVTSSVSIRRVMVQRLMNWAFESVTSAETAP
jgi:hypothetical protein